MLHWSQMTMQKHVRLLLAIWLGDYGERQEVNSQRISVS